MSQRGLQLMLQTCESLKAGLESTVMDEVDKRTIDVALGRTLDAARDNRTYDQTIITRYVLWLSNYRQRKAVESYTGDKL